MKTATRADITLDVRPVAPKDRFETIMGAYRRLGLGEVLMLTVDHDPQCMYYTLKVDYGDDTFGFSYLERGPEVWRVEITRNEIGGE